MTRFAARAAVLVASVPAHPAASSLAAVARRHPLDAPPVLVLATPDDPLIRIRGLRSTAARHGATVVESPGIGHDLMLDARWREPFDAMLGRLGTAVPPRTPS